MEADNNNRAWDEDDNHDPWDVLLDRERRYDLDVLTTALKDVDDDSKAIRQQILADRDALRLDDALRLRPRHPGPFRKSVAVAKFAQVMIQAHVTSPWTGPRLIPRRVSCDLANALEWRVPSSPSPKPVRVKQRAVRLPKHEKKRPRVKLNARMGKAWRR